MEKFRQLQATLLNRKNLEMNGRRVRQRLMNERVTSEKGSQKNKHRIAKRAGLKDELITQKKRTMGINNHFGGGSWAREAVMSGEPTCTNVGSLDPGCQQPTRGNEAAVNRVFGNGEKGFSHAKQAPLIIWGSHFALLSMMQLRKLNCIRSSTTCSISATTPWRVKLELSFEDTP